METIHVGLVGFGMASRVFHAPLIQASDGLNLHAVVERHANDSQKVYPDVNVVRSLDELLENEAIQLIVIATPNVTHYPLAKQALEAGRNVVLDKPFTCNSKQAEELCELAKQNKVVLTAFQNRRWDGDFMTVQKMMNEGLLGRIVSFESHFDRFRPKPKDAWREKAGEGTGLLYDLGSHLIDQAVFAFGQPERIYAWTALQRDGAQTDDAFAVDLYYAQLTVRLHAGVLVAEGNQRFTIHGTKGSFVKWGLDPQEAALKEGEIPGGEGWGQEGQDDWGMMNTTVSGLHVTAEVETLAGNYPAYYQNVRDAINGAAELIVKPEQAANVIRLIEYALQSAKEGRVITV